MRAAPVAVVLPLRDGGPFLEECLAAIAAQSLPAAEVLVVDDRMSPATRERLAGRSLTIIPNRGCGVSAARNSGAQATRQPWVLFTDPDVIWPPDLLERLMSHLESGRWDALSGYQSARMRFADLPSQAKNLWMHHTYRRLAGQGGLRVLYTSLAAVRREVLLAEGGFRKSIAKPWVEDTFLALRLAEAGWRLGVGEGLEVEHARRYTWRELLWTDLSRSRGIGAELLAARLLGRPLAGVTPVPAWYGPALACAGLTGVLLSGAVLCGSGWLWGGAGVAAGLSGWQLREIAEWNRRDRAAGVRLPGGLAGYALYLAAQFAAVGLGLLLAVAAGRGDAQFMAAEERGE